MSASSGIWRMFQDRKPAAHCGSFRREVLTAFTDGFIFSMSLMALSASLLRSAASP